MNTQSLNKKERRAMQLIAHYQTCERLARYCGHPNPDGKRISVLLWKAEQIATKRAETMCSDSGYTHGAEDKQRALQLVERALGTLPLGLFVNGDTRGYGLKIDNEDGDALSLIRTVGLHTDMGGYGILSPEITGNL